MKKNKVKITEFSKLERKVAALWTRVSTEKQERNNCSLENQQRICREYAERNGITIKRNLVEHMKVLRQKVESIAK